LERQTAKNNVDYGDPEDVKRAIKDGACKGQGRVG
jgi:hypothetical protein